LGFCEHRLRCPDGLEGARHVKGTGKSVLTLMGYSGAGDQVPTALMLEASRVLDRHDPARTLINSGGSVEGIGQIYELAKGEAIPSASCRVWPAKSRFPSLPVWTPCSSCRTQSGAFYVSIKKDGGERLNFTAFYEVLLEAKEHLKNPLNYVQIQD
jgi:hypothetical protein